MEVTHSVTTEHGTFTAKTVRAAKRLAAAAGVEKEKQRAIDSRNYEVASMRAESIAFRILRRVLAGEQMAGGWTFFKPNDEYITIWFTPELDMGRGMLRPGPDGGGPAFPVFYNASEFRGLVATSGNECVGYLIRDERKKERFWAVGAEAGQFVDTLVDGVTEAWLNPPAPTEREFAESLVVGHATA